MAETMKADTFIADTIAYLEAALRALDKQRNAMQAGLDALRGGQPAPTRKGRIGKRSRRVGKRRRRVLKRSASPAPAARAGWTAERLRKFRTTIAAKRAKLPRIIDTAAPGAALAVVDDRDRGILNELVKAGLVGRSKQELLILRPDFGPAPAIGLDRTLTRLSALKRIRRADDGKWFAV
jgi:hypothetical protein